MPRFGSTLLSPPRVLGGIVAGLMVADRIHWARVAQWREDEATNLWLGYMARLTRSFPPIGLLSSVGVPNPNGMPLVATFLSGLPDRQTINITLSLLTLVASIWMCAAWRRHDMIWPLMVLASSIQMRSASMNLWNQDITILCVCCFAALLLKDGPIGWKHHFLAYTLALLTASLYLLGILLAAIFLLLWAIKTFSSQADRSRLKHEWLPVSAFVSVVSIGSVYVTWGRYFSALRTVPVHSPPRPPFSERLLEAFEALMSVPDWFSHTVSTDLAPSKHAHIDIVGIRAYDVGNFCAALVTWQTWIFVIGITLAWGLSSIDRAAMKRLLWVLLFIVVAFIASPFVGGFRWHRFERLDQCISLNMLILALVFFSVPVTSQRRHPILLGLQRISRFNALLFCVIQMSLGIYLVNAHLDYRGTTLSNADVPSEHSSQALEASVKDWQSRAPHTDRMPIYYALAGNWAWVPQTGKGYFPYFGSYPFTIGRSLDWELLRKYRMHNTQEGVLDRTCDGQRYVMSYRHETVPLCAAKCKQRFFGRIRLSICS